MTNINNYAPYHAGTYPSFVSSENGCKHEAKNPSRKVVRQFMVDGGVFPKGSGPLRCDWLILNDTDQHAYYIELKGSDIPHAIEQIEATIREVPTYREIHRRIIYKTNTLKMHDHTATKWKAAHQDALVRHLTYTDTL